MHERRRTVGITPRAARALTGYSWPGNVRQLRRVVREAVSRADVVDVQHLAPEVLDSGTRTLTRLERLEHQSATILFLSAANMFANAVTVVVAVLALI